jgi:hypothetical protein
LYKNLPWTKKQCLMLGLAAAVSLGIPSCPSKNNPVSAPATALTLVAPVGGERYSFTDTIPVKWIANPDSIGTPSLHSFTRAYSLDSGRNWISLSYNTASAIQDSNVYQLTWIGLDTTQPNPVTSQPLTKADFLNRGVVVEIVSYPPENITRRSGYIFFHE